MIQFGQSFDNSNLSISQPLLSSTNKELNLFELQFGLQQRSHSSLSRDPRNGSFRILNWESQVEIPKVANIKENRWINNARLIARIVILIVDPTDFD